MTEKQLQAIRAATWRHVMSLSGVPQSVLAEADEPIPAMEDEAPPGEFFAYGMLVDGAEAEMLGWMGLAAFSSAHFRAALARADDADMDMLVRINSPGGMVTEASAIQGMIVDFQAKGRKVIGLVEGNAHSAASAMTLGMDTVRMMELGRMMVHMPWLFAMGSSAEIRKVADELEAMEDVFVGQYARRARVSESDMRQLLEDETMLTSARAVEIGLADEVQVPTPPKKAEAKAKAKEPTPKSLVEKPGARAEAVPDVSTMIAMIGVI